MIIKQRYNVMLNPNIVNILDKIASDMFVSRSEIISKILYQYIIDNNLSLNSDHDEIIDQVCFEEIF